MYNYNFYPWKRKESYFLVAVDICLNMGTIRIGEAFIYYVVKNQTVGFRGLQITS